MTKHEYTIGKYLYKRLEQLGLGHIFGVPGDYIFDLLHLALESNVQYVGTCNELNAGYAADAYARFKGIGAVVITYAVGGLSLVNAVAGAFAEKIPIIIISGGPELEAYDKQPQKHHTLGDYAIPLDIFKKITVASACLLNPDKATSIIDGLLLKCVQYKQPVYLEIPCNIVNYPCLAPDNTVPACYPHSNSNDIKNAVEATLALLRDAISPIIIIGNEIQRYNLQPLVEELITNSGLPFSTFVTDKTTLPESHSQFIGSCGPGICMDDSVRKYIEYSDCLLCLGSIVASHLGAFMSDLSIDKQVSAFNHKVHIKKQLYTVNLRSFIIALNDNFKHSANKRVFNAKHIQPRINEIKRPFNYHPEKKLTHDKFIQRIGDLLKGDDVLIVDSGSSLFVARNIFMPDKTVFLSQSYYASLGYSLPAALGSALANPTRRIFIVVGDGAFQFTCQELSTLIRYGLTPVIFLINNRGYTIERALFKDASYNDIQPWKYHKIPLVFGGSEGHEVTTEGELENAIKSFENQQKFSFIEVHLDKLDYSPDLEKTLEP